MLALRRADVQTLWDSARAAVPREVCGVLGGREAGGVRQVEVVHPCRNVAPRPEWEFVAHPDDQLRAFLDIEDRRGLKVLGVYHSHPRGPPAPSAVDAARAAYPGASYLVLWLAPEEGWGSWRWDPPQGFVREDVAVVEGFAQDLRS